MKIYFLNYSKLFFFISLFCHSLQNAQLLNPSIKNYSINDYNADNQNWGIDVDNNGVVFAANNKGLLRYNGQKWELFQLPNKTIIRSVLCSNDKIFTGSYEEFGYWEKDVFGNYNYKTLVSLLPKDYKFTNDEIWQIINYKDNIVFKSFSKIYIYDGKALKIINDSDNILDVTVYNDELLANSLLKGLLVFNGKELVPHKLSQTYKKIKNITSFKNNLFIYDENKGAVIVHKDKKNNTSKELNNLLNQFLLNKISFISENKVLLGTVNNGIIIYKIDDNDIKVIDRSAGIQNNTILGQKIKNNNIWLALDNGVSKISINNISSFYKDFSGRIGAVYDLAFLHNKLYLASNTGLYTFNNNSLKLVENTKGHIWNILPHEDYLLGAHNSGTKIFKNDKEVYYESKMGGVYSIKPIPNSTNTFLQGTYIGLSILKKISDTNWSTKILKGVSFPVDNFEFESDSVIWFTHPYKGVYRARINEKLSKIEAIESFGQNNYLKEYKTKIYKINREILLYNSNQWFYFSKENKAIKPYKPLKYFTNKNFVGKYKNENWFINKNKELIYLADSYRDSLFLNSTQIKKRLITGFEKIIVKNDSIRFLNLNDGFAKFDITQLKINNKKPELPIIDKIYTRKREFKLEDKTYEIPFNEAELITIEAYSPKEYENSLTYIINGRVKYSGITNNGKILLQNLNFGNYELVIKNNISSIDDKKGQKIFVRVLRPWYLTYWMLFVYALILFVIFLYIKRYNKQKVIKEQTEIQNQLILNTQKKINKIEKENLKKEIDTKKKVLAVITESIIKKNEIIIILKNELSRLAKAFPNEYISKKLLKVAQESISNNRDWKVFEESFNDLHEDFLKKLVAKYPKFTSKDLKLCAYIKTGYTSKEIAPLLGISIRGVELQRYRLRKKINLPKEQSIYDFLITL